MKKAILILCAVCTALCLSISVFAAEVYTEKTFEYMLADESVTIVGYFGKEAEVTVPSIIAGYPVNTIAAGAFTQTSIQRLNLPDTVTTIEGGAIRLGITVVYCSNVPTPDHTSSGTDTPSITPNTTSTPENIAVNTDISSPSSPENTTMYTNDFSTVPPNTAENTKQTVDISGKMTDAAGTAIEEDGTLEGTEGVLPDNNNREKSEDHHFRFTVLFAAASCILAALIIGIVVWRRAAHRKTRTISKQRNFLF